MERIHPVNVLSVNGIDFIVLSIIALGVILVVVHLIRIYKKSPCGDCASAKQCQAFSKDKILKAYKKQCKIEERNKKKEHILES